MTLTELLNHLSSLAATYRRHAASAIVLNSHMHDYKGEPLTQEQVDALLSNFLNFVAVSWGVEYALIAKDFEQIAAQPIPELKVGMPVPQELFEEEEPDIVVPGRENKGKGGDIIIP